MAYTSNVADSKMIELKTLAQTRAAAARLDESVALLTAVADPIRWTVLQRLAAAPSCVCEIQAQIPIAANLLSYHLKVLREARLVTTSRRGRWVDYAIAEDAHDRLRAALPGAAGIVDHTTDEPS
jgi:ArsR family transcriptional regulator, arsenate/arsenite/antimonite-responsive transcriptional repressor